MRVMLTGFFVVDIIAYNLDRIPQPGEIVRTDYFYVSTGGHPLNIGIDLVKLGLSGSSVFVCGSVADLLPAMNGEGSCYCGEVWDYIPSSRGFNPGPGLRPITPTPPGARGYA